MKKFYLIVFILITVATVFCAQRVLAADWFGSTFDTLGHAAGPAGYGEPVDPRLIVSNIVKIVLGLVATILFGLNIYAGFLWMTAAGNDEKVAQAKNIIRDSTIGLIIVLSAYGITIAVTNIALGRSIGSGSQAEALQNESGNLW